MDQDQARAAIAAMFDAEGFRIQGHALIDLLADLLAQQLAGRGKVLDWREPTDEDLRWRQPLPQMPAISADGLLARLKDDILAGNLAIHHPHNLGHQVAAPLPQAALCDLVAALANQAMAVYETGPSATMLERQVLRWLAELVGWPQAQGVLTSGGAQANLTALLAARQATLRRHGIDAWQDGVGARPLRILASEHAHYSVARAAGIMGLGSAAVVKVAADDAGGMRPDALAAAHWACLDEDAIVIAVAATASCTPTGSVDPLREIGQYCRAQQLWLHVDGAHGASMLLSPQRREQLDGMELADSLTWDGHKLLYMPAAVSAVLFRHGADSYAAFAQDASYLFQGETAEAEAYNVSYRTLECTKRMMGLKLWAAFSLYGVEGLGMLVDEVCGRARLFSGLVAAHPQFELLMAPQTNIVCFRHLQPGLAAEALSRHQATLRQRIVQSGAYHLTQVEYRGEIWLRVTLMNPFTEQAHLAALLDLMTRSSA